MPRSPPPITTARAPRHAARAIDVAHVAERHHAGQICAGDGQAHGPRTGSKDELGEWQRRTVRQRDGARGHIDSGDAGAVAQGDAAVAPPRRGLERNVARRDLAGQHRRQQHAIISKPRLFTDHRDGVTAKRALGELFAQSRRRHAVADDDQRLAHSRAKSD
jgi:hypothetical protein